MAIAYSWATPLLMMASQPLTAAQGPGELQRIVAVYFLVSFCNSSEGILARLVVNIEHPDQSG